ncbi:unnamed protein product [Urochloa humidicola]
MHVEACVATQAAALSHPRPSGAPIEQRKNCQAIEGKKNQEKKETQGSSHTPGASLPRRTGGGGGGWAERESANRRRWGAGRRSACRGGRSRGGPEEAERVEGLLVGRREGPGHGGGGFEGAEEEVGQACSAAACCFSVRGFLSFAVGGGHGEGLPRQHIRIRRGEGIGRIGHGGVGNLGEGGSAVAWVWVPPLRFREAMGNRERGCGLGLARKERRERRRRDRRIP